jgi:hypothetical protein
MSNMQREDIKEETRARFIEAVSKQQEVLITNPGKVANKLDDLIFRLYAKIVRLDAIDIFYDCLNHSNDDVRFKSAAFLYDCDPEISRKVITELYKAAEATHDIFMIADCRFMLERFDSGEWSKILKKCRDKYKRCWKREIGD